MALAPILVLIGLTVVARRSVVFSAANALWVLVAAALWWGTSLNGLAAAGARGLFVAVEIILIVFGALLIVELIRRQNLFEPVQQMLAQISGDYRVQALIIGFGLVYFIEGTAGFGTPAIVAVPLLLALGFNPLHAVVLSLVGDTIPVSFGAVGLPITFGVDSVLASLTPEHAALTAGVISQVAILNVPASVLLALLIVGLVVRLKRDRWRALLEMVPFATLSGLAVALPAYAVAVTIGPELPSIIGGLAGVFVIGWLARRGFLLPASATNKGAPATGDAAAESGVSRTRLLWRALYPYLLLIGLLILTRLPQLPVGGWLGGLEFSTPGLLGSDVDYAIAPLYSVAAILLVCAFVTMLLVRRRIGRPGLAVRDVFGRIRRPFAALLLVLVFVQIFIYSGGGRFEESMPMAIAQTVSGWSGGFWPFLAPAIGALGSFLSGSATVSNLIFSGVQYDVARSLALDPVPLLSLQTLGASIGNMIALHNVIAALTIAGLSEAESYRVIRANLIPVGLLLLVFGLIGLAIT